jgi:hypothetical protein
MIIGEKKTDLKRLTGRLRLRFLTELGDFIETKAKKSIASFLRFVNKLKKKSVQKYFL